VPRFVHRRAIVFFVLLCQLMAVGVVHVPTAKAAQGPPVAATSGHCHDSAPTASMDGAKATVALATATSHTTASHTTRGDQSSDAGHHCKSGFCACVCAHAPAGLAGTPAAASPQVSRPPLLMIDSVRSAPERATIFFRPPI
jgi:hypothetical protein